jgi:hypothetical protein
MQETELYTQQEREIINSFMDNMELFISRLPPVEVGIKDVFAPGIYVRKMWVPGGGIMTSKVHRTEHIFMVTKGRILVYDGIHQAVILKAPYDGKTLPGTRRMGIALEDTVWANIHPTRIKPNNNTDEAKAKAVARIEKRIIEPYTNLKLTSHAAPRI